ncbi:MAG: hypothetical protein AAF656_13930 [Planctomycetota bacterium]
MSQQMIQTLEARKLLFGFNFDPAAFDFPDVDFDPGTDFDPAVDVNLGVGLDGDIDIDIEIGNLPTTTAGDDGSVDGFAFDFDFDPLAGIDPVFDLPEIDVDSLVFSGSGTLGGSVFASSGGNTASGGVSATGAFVNGSISASAGGGSSSVSGSVSAFTP